MMNESSQPRSPINELPREILCEIFARCVVHSSTRVLRQPNTNIAPMLLCHVCAPWRAAVLSLPTLWAHLRFELPLNWHRNRRLSTWDAKVLRRRLEWLRWLTRNLGGMAPYLQVELRQKQAEKYRRSRLSEAICEFLLEFLSSAQYISVELLYKYLVQRRRDAGYLVRVHPGAHTIVSTWVDASENDDPAADTYNQYLISVLTQTRSTLRHLVIENAAAKFRPEEFMNPLNSWSILTHLSMSLVYIHLNTWFSFIRSLRALQTGSFSLMFLDTTIDTYTAPSVGTLPSLASLHVSAFGKYRDTGQYPLTAAFAHLQLPTLCSLSLASREAAWADATALAEVRAALVSAPAITELTLGALFLGGQTLHPGIDFYSQAPILEIAPLAEWAPCLAHLRFALARPLGGGTRTVARYVDRVFASSRWLDLKSPASTVREVTFVLADKSDSERIDVVAEDADRRLLLSEARKFVKDGVIVRFVEEGPVEVQRAVWGW